jgi:hypothetical protein
MIPARLLALDDALVAAGFPVMSPWWRSTLASFYESGKRQLVLRVGRRGGKSSTLCRVAVVEALYGEHVITPGDVGIIGIVSVSRDEASQRLRTIKAILGALGVAYRPIEGGIELEHKPVAFKVFAASVAGVVGGTWITAICDEVARWRDSDTGANPAKEVLASLRPTMATQPNARIFLSSSPLGPDDAHATAFDASETAFQSTAYAPTWEAHPAITEDATHALEPDIRVWRREYKAEPQSAACAAFDPDLVARAIGPVEDIYLQCPPILLLDPTAGQSDVYTYAVARWRVAPELARWQTKRVWVPGADWAIVPLNDADGNRIPNPEWSDQLASKLEFVLVAGIENAARRGLTSDHIVKHIVGVAHEYGACAVHSDQFERFALASAIGKYGLPFIAHSWTAPLKERAVERVRQWLRDGALSLPVFDKLKKELLAFEERIAPSGALTFRGRQGGHDDHAMLVMLAALVDIEGQIPGSPLAPRPRQPFPTWLVA